MKYGPILWGSMGGILPNIVQKAQQLINSSPEDTLEAIIYPTFLLGVALVACIGAIIVAAFREEDSRKALFLGIGAPALIMVVASAPNQGASTPAVNGNPTAPVVQQQQQTFIPWFVDAAYADDRRAPPPENNLVPGRFVEVIATGESEPFNIDFLNDKNELITSASLPNINFGKLPLPPNATSIRFSKGDERSSVYSLPLETDKTKAFLVNVSGERAYGFWTAFGAAPKVSYSFTVKEELTKPAPAGTEGWAYAGKFEDRHWVGQFFDFAEGKLPQKGSKVKVQYPVNLRQEGNKDSKWIGELRLGQEVEILTSTSVDDVNYWIRLKVIQ
ncbi:MAG: hypothetical protein KJ914_01480 [Gammaproteobacteria bacterium]|nr:hypothetical protein [Gammaproteobacteria bacterium]MBU1725137.1 hypothetical protein [Gammaproteobacteria bacterium]MBU2005576.1 hypothetical protein [Gammaproteobacteria bacterium]